MFPSIITSFPIVSPTDRLNNPSHSSLENLQSSTIGQLQAFIGTDSSALGTLIYDVRSPDSGGGGHVQTANKGGTGQTTYTKGDILAATSTSVLSKLAIGLDGQQLVADSSVAAGVKWGVATGSKIYVNASIFTIRETALVGERSILSAIIPASTLGTNNAVRAIAFLDMQGFQSSVVFRGRYGGNTVGSVILRNASPSISGELRFDLMENEATNAQRGVLSLHLASKTGVAGVSVMGLWDSNTSSVASGVAGTLGLTAMGADTTIVVNGVIVEKIT